MTGLFLTINFDLGVVFLTLSAFTVPGIMISHLILKRHLNKAETGSAIVYYLLSGFVMGTLLFIFLLFVLVGGAKYIK